ncbi:MAG: tRNA (adenosine(37)-N6)-threonylcarbamoyltransferase complex dimerization subunit type 1 TsaB [Planctomycetota bacterium]|nr:tRNA (adenosine(37)-N6)-threonylcarbamoyltransferase complex dimerization subunit type 1 TsaB [Planctomycetota bacterium]MCX8040696.1 tRNA (adenosine(37)-N6)-threonylcarbamoyltransferase complex dimerization subunit type 1 TsaB [Planctomycetota bacterium]MDW8373454.1 tRNA (adenosine(37)-N6)-threonylcarbamoyltransferase complex dimerization subunit type 1 TsaB [Planctomycetota bacterium]
MLIACEAVDRCGSVCAWDGRVIAWERCPGPAEAQLVPLLDGYVRRYRPLTAFAVAAGPGSFTGLRVSVLAVRTLGWLEAVPIYAVDSLVACAIAQGQGTWVVLLPLKRDTTFHAVVRVHGSGIEVLSPTSASHDQDQPQWPPVSEAVVIGPALASKPSLVERWLPGVPRGSPAGPDARAVARLAALSAPRPWDAVLPIYHQEPAPVLQRARRLHQNGVA